MPRKYSDKRSYSQELEPAEALRLRSWTLDIVRALLPDSNRRDGRDDVQFDGGLRIQRTTGIWYHHAHGVGGHCVVKLVALLKSCSRADAVQWAHAFLTAHAGYGSCNGAESDDDDDDGHSTAAAAANIDRAKEYLQHCVPIEGTPGEVYLRGRGCELLPAWLHWLPPNVARLGEGAVVAVLQAGGIQVGLQLTFVTQDGIKSLIEPVRRTHKLEQTPRARAGAFGVMPEPTELARQAKDPHALPLLICEGAEDTLSLMQAFPNHVVVGAPGVRVLQHLSVAPDTAIVVCRDGDDPDSPAAKALIRGVDHLLLQRATVKITAPPLDEDNNDIWRSGGAEALHALIEAATPASLSLDGEAIRCAPMQHGAYDAIRRDVAKRLGVRVGTLDAYVRAAAQKLQQEQTPPEPEPVWEGEISLQQALDATLTQLKRFIVAPEPALAVCSVWLATTHLSRNDTVRLSRAVILNVQSRLPGAGKTTTCEGIASLCPTGTEVLSVYTPSSLKRRFHEAAEQGIARPIPVLDEADRNIRADSDLVPFLNGCTRRRSANASFSVALNDKTWKSVTVNCFGPVLLSGIDCPPPTIADRSIAVLMERETAEQLLEELPDEPPPEIEQARLHLAAWAAARSEPLKDPPAPDWLRRRAGRTARNWLQMLAIATEAGGRWPELIEQAAQQIFNAEHEPTQMERLLTSIRRMFDARRAELAQAKETKSGPALRWEDKDAVETADRVLTTSVVASLNNEADEEWHLANAGRPVSSYFLRNRLLNLLKPAGAHHWWTGPEQHRKQYSGYYRQQFEDAWRRYLPSHTPPTGSCASCASCAADANSEQFQGDNRQAPAQDAPETATAAQDAAPDATAAAQDATTAAPDAVQPNPRFSTGFSEAAQDAQDAHHRVGGVYEDNDGAFVDLVRTARAEHPNWSIARLAKQLKQPQSRVKAALEPAP